MKSLKDYINESVLSNPEETLKNVDKAAIKIEISKFIDKYYRCPKGYEILDETDENERYKVNANSNAVVKNKRILSLTNGLFVWNIVGGWFDCRDCERLTSLEGAPVDVGGYFSCDNCKNIKSLEYAPKIVGSLFTCKNCGRKFTESEVKSVCELPWENIVC